MTPSLIRQLREPVKLLGAGVGHRDQDSDKESVEDVLLEVPHDVDVRDPEGLGVDSQLAEGDAHRLGVALDHLDQVVPETGRGQLSLKVPNIQINLVLSFQCICIC